MNRSFAFCLKLLLLLFTCCGTAHAQLLTQNDLYLDAIKSITEGKQQEASDALMQMIEKEPQHAGAWLDLAIIQCELGRAAEAERLFGIIESRFQPPPAITDVIAKQRATGCKGWQPRHNFSVSLGRGIDNNVNQGASNPNFTLGTGTNQIQLQLLPEFLPRSDHYTFLAADYIYDLNPKGGIVFAQARAQQNDTLSSFNTTSFAVGAEQPWRLGEWGVRGSGVVAMLGLGGTLYQRQTQLQLRVIPPLPLPKTTQFSVLGSVNHITYATLEGFDSTTWELRGIWEHKSSRSQEQLSLGYLNDHALGSRPGGDRDGWYGSINTRIRLPHSLTGEFSWTEQTWTSSSVYSQGLIDQIRHQNTQILRGALIYPIAQHQNLTLELRRVRNNENISLFQYSSRQLQLTWQWQNF